MRVLLIKKDKIENKSYELSKKEENYLKNVLRIKEGESFKAKDEKERLYDATLIGSSLILDEIGDAEFLDTMPSFSGHFQKIDLYQSILKGKKNEKVVREAQEAGVNKTTFITTKFIEQKELSEHDKERLFAVRKEAVQQSGAKVMEISEVISFTEAIENAEGKIIILHQSTRGKTKSIREALSGISKETTISCFIGPEGGFSDEECEKAEVLGAIPVLLKTNILRAETASIYTISAIQTLLNE